MKVVLFLFIGASLLLPTLAQGEATSLSDTNTFDLEVTFHSPSARGEFSMLTTLRVEEPFSLSAMNGGEKREISGVLHRRQGKFILDLTATEPGISDTMRGLELELGKPWCGGPVASFVFMRIIKLQKHQSRLALPQHATK